MKKCVVSVLALFFVLSVFVFCGFCSDHSRRYPETLIITGFDEKNDLVFCETSTGYKYSFIGIEDYSISDLVSCIMNDNGTPVINDDYILESRYAGYNAGVYNG